MNKRIENTSGSERLLSIVGLAEYTNLGRNSAVKLGMTAGAKIKVGRRTLFDKAKVDRYLDQCLYAGIAGE